tara:strand:- start:119 stop:679 length:561 start_codon:yes stop_codon:yes gene_type:complete
MIGFSQFSQVNSAELVRQRMLYFFAAYFILNPKFSAFFRSPIIPTDISNFFRDALFSGFVKELKNKKVYEEYLICSLFGEQPNYDFITREETQIINEARKALKETFNNVLKNYFVDSPDNTIEPLYVFSFPEESEFKAFFIDLAFKRTFLIDPVAFFQDNDTIPIGKQNEIIDNTLKSLINFDGEE